MGPSGRVSEMQAKLHRWAVAEPQTSASRDELTVEIHVWASW